MSRWTVRPMFAWFDLWVGVYIDRPNQRIYVFPLPCLGLAITTKAPLTGGQKTDTHAGHSDRGDS